MILKGGSPAIHKLGDIGRENDSKIRVGNEDEEYYIGNFEEGFGFIDVKFKKSDCRPLTNEERDNLNGSWYTINGNPLYKIYVDEEGNIINGKVTTIKGKITKVLSAETNEIKYSPFKNMTVEFGEDIVIGHSLIMFTANEGSIQTSKVNDYKLTNKVCIIHTNNSIYYIERL
jgi:hypothetical protein